MTLGEKRQHRRDLRRTRSGSSGPAAGAAPGSGCREREASPLLISALTASAGARCGIDRHEGNHATRVVSSRDDSVCRRGFVRLGRAGDRCPRVDCGAQRESDWTADRALPRGRVPERVELLRGGNSGCGKRRVGDVCSALERDWLGDSGQPESRRRDHERVRRCRVRERDDLSRCGLHDYGKRRARAAARRDVERHTLVCRRGAATCRVELRGPVERDVCERDQLLRGRAVRRSDVPAHRALERHDLVGLTQPAPRGLDPERPVRRLLPVGDPLLRGGRPQQVVRNVDAHRAMERNRLGRRRGREPGRSARSEPERHLVCDHDELFRGRYRPAQRYTSDVHRSVDRVGVVCGREPEPGSCVVSRVWRVSTPLLASRSAPESGRPLIEQWNGTAWSADSTPGAGDLSGLACASAENCFGVGETTAGVGLIERWERDRMDRHGPSERRRRERHLERGRLRERDDVLRRW